MTDDVNLMHCLCKSCYVIIFTQYLSYCLNSNYPYIAESINIYILFTSYRYHYQFRNFYSTYKVLILCTNLIMKKMSNLKTLHSSCFVWIITLKKSIQLLEHLPISIYNIYICIIYSKQSINSFSLFNRLLLKSRDLIYI